jgi:hypothetical protein
MSRCWLPVLCRARSRATGFIKLTIYEAYYTKVFKLQASIGFFAQLLFNGTSTLIKMLCPQIDTIAVYKSHSLFFQ